MSPPPAEPDAAAAADPAAEGAAAPPPDPKAALSAAWLHVQELLSYGSQYAAAKVGGTVLFAKRLAVLAVLLAVLAIVGVAMLATAAVLLVIGIAEALATPLPERFAWLGYVVVGLVGAVGVPLVGWLVARSIASAGRSSAVEAYARRLQRQREQFGVDAADRAAAAAQPVSKQRVTP